MKRAIPLLLLLSACQFLTPHAAAFRDFNPLEVAPDQLEAGFVLTPGLTLPTDGAELIATATRTDTGEEIAETFILSQTDDTRLTGLMINPADYDRFTGVQDSVRAWEAEAPRATSGSITITARLCETAPGSAADARLSIWMGRGPDHPLVPMVEDLPVTEFIPADGILPGDDPICEA